MRHLALTPDIARYPLTAEGEPLQASSPEPPPLSPRAKVGTWLGLSVLLWSPIIAAVAVLT
jgi:hypothetical protein